MALSEEALREWKGTMSQLKEAYKILTKDQDEYDEEHEDEEDPEDLEDLQEHTRADIEPDADSVEYIQCVEITLSAGSPVEYVRLFFRDDDDTPFEGEWWFAGSGPAEFVSLSSEEIDMMMEVYGIMSPSERGR